MKQHILSLVDVLGHAQLDALRLAPVVEHRGALDSIWDLKIDNRCLNGVAMLPPTFTRTRALLSRRLRPLETLRSRN